MKPAKQLLNATIIRFALVGFINTALDFILFNSLLAVSAGNDPSRYQILVCNTISVSFVAVFSFILNRRYVFRATHTPHHYAVYFVIITLAGLYIVQNGIIYLVTHLLAGEITPFITFLNGLGLEVSAVFVLANLGKLVGTCGSMAWNYLMYKHAVFTR